MADWVRKTFSSTGLTQVPPGPHLAALQQRHSGGAVLLLLDVSGSMSGTPIVEAVRGARTFVGEAVDAGYEVAVVLWNTRVVAASGLARTPSAALGVLDQARAGGGNDLLVPLLHAEKALAGRGGDRVVAVFGDGDLTPKAAVLEQVARMKADDIRFVTRGLGQSAAREFGEVTSEAPETAEVVDVSQLAAGIAGMAASLRARGKR